MAKKISEFSKYVVKKRINAKLSYQDVADAVGVSRPYIYDIEKGNNKPPIDYQKLDGWATVLGLRKRSRELLFDKAVEERDEVPADIKKEILENDRIKKVIRKCINGDLPKQLWDSVLESVSTTTEEDVNDDEE